MSDAADVDEALQESARQKEIFWLCGYLLRRGEKAASEGFAECDQGEWIIRVADKEICSAVAYLAEFLFPLC